MCPKESSHLALLEVPEPEVQAQVPEQEPVRTLQAPARVLLGQEPALERVLLQRGRRRRSRSGLSLHDRGSSSPETARAARASDFPLHSTGAGAAAGVSGSAFASEVPGWQAAPRVVNKTQPGKNQGP